MVRTLATCAYIINITRKIGRFFDVWQINLFKCAPCIFYSKLGMADIDILVHDYCKASISQLSRLLI